MTTTTGAVWASKLWWVGSFVASMGVVVYVIGQQMQVNVPIIHASSQEVVFRYPLLHMSPVVVKKSDIVRFSSFDDGEVHYVKIDCVAGHALKLQEGFMGQVGWFREEQPSSGVYCFTGFCPQCTCATAARMLNEWLACSAKYETTTGQSDI